MTVRSLHTPSIPMVSRLRSTPALTGRLQRVRSIGMFSLGVVCATVLPALLAEGLLRALPPADLDPYLGDSSSRSDVFQAHPQFAITYRSWETFCEEYQDALAPHLPLTDHPDSRPVWAFFGNSFIQAPGMLGDVVTAAVPEKRILYLRRNELLPVRLAQIELLLDAGLRPERIFIELMPIDTLPLHRHPLDSYRVTSKGALTFQPRLPTGCGRWAIEHSRLALTAWVRSGLHEDVPGDLCRGIDATLRSNLDRMFGHLAQRARAYGVPVTILLIPAHEQSLGRSTFGFNDAVREVLAKHGYDFIDPREAFVRHPDPQQLYIPDKHLSDAGNELLLAELLQQLPATGSATASVHQESISR